MPTDLFRDNLARYRAACSLEAGCEESAFDSHALTVVPRPPAARDQRPAQVLTFGTGTVITVQPDYLDWARTLVFKRHFDAFSPSAFARPMLAEMERRGSIGAARGASLGFLPGVISLAPELPPNVRVLRIDRDWRAKRLESGVFDNSLGEPGEAFPELYWRWGLALIDAAGEPIAVTGAYDDGEALLEVGVDVIREHRGRGLAHTLVSVMNRAIADEGCTATYYCAATNIRSHRTALAAGFVPVLTHTGIRVTEGITNT